MPDRPSIWIVDDSAFARRLLLKQIADAGVDARGFSSGREAADALAHAAPALVVLDSDMPDLDGLATARLLRDRGFGGPLVICTASPEFIDGAACEEAGVLGVYAKPLDADATHAILSFLDGRPGAEG